MLFVWASLYIISSPGLKFKCMRDDGPQDFICAGKHCPNINTVIPSSQTPKRTAIANLALSEPRQRKVCRHIPINVYVPIYDKTNSSSDIWRLSALITVYYMNLRYRQIHNFNIIQVVGLVSLDVFITWEAKGY